MKGDFNSSSQLKCQTVHIYLFKTPCVHTSVLKMPENLHGSMYVKAFKHLVLTWKGMKIYVKMSVKMNVNMFINMHLNI